MFLFRFIFLFFSFCAVSHGAVVLQYHRFGDSRYPSANVTMEQFRSHLDYLRDEGFEVVSLSRLFEDVRAGRVSDEDKIAALSVDDAFLSFYDNALPVLVEYGYPVTLFVVAESSDRGGDYMDWSMLRSAVSTGLVEIGSQTLSHPHLPLLSSEDLARELFMSRQVIGEKLGVDVLFMAYPYGEASLAVMEATGEAGYIGAFGQHSGAIGSDILSNFLYYLPRFSINEVYGNLRNLSVKLESLPLSVRNFAPLDPVLGEHDIIDVRFDFAGETGGLTCYHSNFGLVDKEVLFGEVLLSFDKVFNYGRSRLNCTKLGIGGRYHWFGWQFIRYGADGKGIH